MLTALWYLTGLIGCALIWNSERRLMRFSACPTPRAVLLILFGAIGGPLALAVGLAICLIDLSFVIGDWLRGTWFTRPICRRTND